jgi:hypothetical protein
MSTQPPVFTTIGRKSDEGNVLRTNDRPLLLCQVTLGCAAVGSLLTCPL